MFVNILIKNLFLKTKTLVLENLSTAFCMLVEYHCVFKNDRNQEAKLDARFAGTATIICQLPQLILKGREIGKKGNAHKYRVMSERVTSLIQTTEMEFLCKISEVTLLDGVLNLEIKESLVQAATSLH